MIKCVIAKFCGGPLYDAAGCRNILQITESRFTSKPPCLKNHSFYTGDFKILKTVGKP
jgi:hypothetical protein